VDNLKPLLLQLADLFGINHRYTDMRQRVRYASDESILAALQAMKAPVNKIEDVPQALMDVRKTEWEQIIQPVIVLRQREPLIIEIKAPASLIDYTINVSLSYESGETDSFTQIIDETDIITEVLIDNQKYISARIDLNRTLPFGYHALQLEILGQIYESLIISAPLKAFGKAGTSQKTWGVFLPLYSLHSLNSWGAGDFNDLESLIEWTAVLGGKITGTLPLLPSFYDKQYGPGPYMPASRLFWNEFYLDISRIPELELCPGAAELLNSNSIKKCIEELRSLSHVDYTKQMSIKRRILLELSDCFFNLKDERLSEFYEYSMKHPELENYAAFRAAVETNGLNWHEWPGNNKPGKVNPEMYSSKSKQYYMYTSWLADQQMNQLAQTAQEHDVMLYMDLPIGVHPFSYDIWNYSDYYVENIKTGAPPDTLFTSGQNWNFPPFNPVTLRNNHYEHFINIIRHQLKYAGLLRIDHIMGLHRLFWIPDGMENSEGLYVNYPAEELYAVLCLESFRNETTIIGEDLGLVPAEVRQSMNKHNIYRMFIGQYELISESKIGNIPANSIAGLNTHDMFPFKAFWEELDIAERLNIGLLNETTAQQEQIQRKFLKMEITDILNKNYPGFNPEDGIQEVFNHLMLLLAVSPAHAVLVNLEDACGETKPQNIPGTQDKSNWTKKAKYSLEELSRMPAIIELLKSINKIRKSAG
jgi:4-alpha-glucanotransferase